MPPRSLRDGLLALEFPEAELVTLDAAVLALAELRYMYETEVVLADASRFVGEAVSINRRRLTPRLPREEQAELTHFSYGSAFVVDLVVQHWDEFTTGLVGVFAAVAALPRGADAVERLALMPSKLRADREDNRAREVEARIRQLEGRQRLRELEGPPAADWAPPIDIDAFAEGYWSDEPILAPPAAPKKELSPPIKPDARRGLIVPEDREERRHLRERLMGRSLRRLRPLVGEAVTAELLLPGERRKTRRGETD